MCMQQQMDESKRKIQELQDRTVVSVIYME